MFSSLQFNLKDLIAKAEEIKTEKNKAAIATANAEIRRGKNYLRGELPKLRKMMEKKMKGLTDEEKEERVSQVDNFEYQIECVPDGVNKAPPAAPKPRGAGAMPAVAPGAERAGTSRSTWRTSRRARG